MRARRRLLASAALVERARHARAAAALGGRVRYASAVPRVPQGGGLRLEFGATCTPHPSKVDKGGEDAYFADGSIGAFGVSDGVGGSADARTDPGLFSRTLLRHCHAQLASAGGVADDPDGLAAAVRHAASEFRRESVGGAATLAIGGLAPSGTLNVLNVGDSQTLLLRPRPRLFESRQRLWPRLVLLSHQSTHYFNCPYQMSADTVEHALENESDMLSAIATRGDVVVAATDGVFDNLFTEQVQALVGRHVGALYSPDRSQRSAALGVLSSDIAEHAVRIGTLEDDAETVSPFSVAAAREGKHYPGGKLDDIAIVVGLVWNDADAPGEGDGTLPELLSNF